MISGWRGITGPYGSGAVGGGTGGGLGMSRLPHGRVLAISPGQAGGGGQVPSSGAALTGYGGCGGPGPAALYGLGGR